LRGGAELKWGFEPGGIELKGDIGLVVRVESGRAELGMM
jgi:hypothetical protein